MPKIIYLVILLSIMISLCLARDIDQEKGDRIIGIWQTDVKDARIEVYRVGKIYYGKILWLQHIGVPQNVPYLDSNNPDPDLRCRTRENIIALKDLVYIGKNRYRDGKVYYPTNGKSYRCSATLNDENSISLHPYVGLRFLGINIKFTRVK